MFSHFHILTISHCFPCCSCPAVRACVLFRVMCTEEARGKHISTSLMRAIKRFPKRHGLCRLHCNELTVICWDCCTATATTCTASYMSAASVCKPNTEERIKRLTWRSYSQYQATWIFTRLKKVNNVLLKTQHQIVAQILRYASFMMQRIVNILWHSLYMGS